MPVRNASTYLIGQKVWWVTEIGEWCFGYVTFAEPDGLEIRTAIGSVFLTWKTLER